jgi:hypothetical protein
MEDSVATFWLITGHDIWRPTCVGCQNIHPKSASCEKKKTP